METIRLPRPREARKTRKARIDKLAQLIRKHFSQLRSVEAVLMKEEAPDGVIHLWTVLASNNRRVEVGIYGREAIVMNELTPAILPLDWHIHARDGKPLTTAIRSLQAQCVYRRRNRQRAS